MTNVTKNQAEVGLPPQQPLYKPLSEDARHLLSVSASRDKKIFNVQTNKQTDKQTRHTASTSMYWLTFYVHRNTSLFVPRTPPVKSRIPHCHKKCWEQPRWRRPRPLPVYGARFWGHPPSPAGGQNRISHDWQNVANLPSRSHGRL